MPSEPNDVFKSNKTLDEQILAPGDLARSGTLTVGLDFGGIRHREFTVGPLNVDADMAAEVEMPDWIDSELTFRFFLHSMKKEERDKYCEENDVDIAQTPAPTENEKKKARRMIATRRWHQARHRVISLGTIPRPSIPAALGKLSQADMQTIVDLCEEVDDAERRFREQNEKDLADGTATGKGGGSDGPADEMDL